MATEQVAKLEEVGGWRIDIIVQGYPGKSVCHGALGWSTIALLRGHGRVVLIDVGSFAQRQPPPIRSARLATLLAADDDTRPTDCAR